MHLVTVGNGNMARLMARLSHSHGYAHTSVGELADFTSAPLASDVVVIHVGTNRLFPSVLQVCEERGYPLIQASSNNDIIVPETVKTHVILAPNLALPVLVLFDILPRFGQLMQGLGAKVDIIESHQATKTSPPITAQKIAGFFGLPPDSVESIRDPLRQREELQVPEGHLAGHAHHYIDIEVAGVEVYVGLQIHGRDAYFHGAVAVAKKLLEHKARMRPGVCTASSFMMAAL